MGVQFDRPRVGVQRVSVLVELVVEDSQRAPHVRVVRIAVAACTREENRRQEKIGPPEAGKGREGGRVGKHLQSQCFGRRERGRAASEFLSSCAGGRDSVDEQKRWYLCTDLLVSSCYVHQHRDPLELHLEIMKLYDTSSPSLTTFACKNYLHLKRSQVETLLPMQLN